MIKSLYVIAASEAGPVKIGISNDPDKRLKQLQTGHAEKLAIHHVHAIGDEDRCRVFEGLIHEANRHRKKQGEWFSMSVKEAIGEIQFAVIRYDDEPNLVQRFRTRRR